MSELEQNNTTTTQQGQPQQAVTANTSIQLLGASQGAQLEVDTFDTPFDAIQQC